MRATLSWLLARPAAAAALAASMALLAGEASATTIFSAQSATASSTFISAVGNDYGIDNTFDQSGLSDGYESGVTDFDSYVASRPTHVSTGSGNEWFSANGASRGVSVVYDLGSVLKVDRLALWNEEFAGLGKVSILASTDGVTFTLLSTLLAEDNRYTRAGRTSKYGPEVVGFLATALRYVKIEIISCPGAPTRHESYLGCGIGEIAFSGERVLSPIPVPAALPLLVSGLGLAGWAARFRRRRPQV